jgi:hypothetical protein
MDLVTLRQKFVELSGHYDLVVNTTDWADNGADFYINAAQEWLDRNSNFWKKTSRLYDELSVGTWYKTFQRCRIIEDVYINNSEGRSKLEKKDFHYIHENYSSLISDTDQGTPLYYCPANLRTQDATDVDNLGAFFNYTMADDETYRGVLIFPPPDEAIVIEVFGQFYSADLSDDADESFWSINHPSLLILASLYQLEILAHRNTQGANDYLIQLQREIMSLDKDIAEEESFGVNQIED